jgi:sporulation protein YlmC with PRC-barrel domain
MRSLTMSILAATCSLVLAASGLAQSNQPAQQNQQNQEQAQEQQLPAGQDQYAQQLMEPDRLQGMKVHDAQGEEIGKVEQIVLDAMNGRIGYIVVRSGGFLGMGSEESIIPWSAVQFHPSRQQQQDKQEEPFLMVNMPKGRLLAAPHGDVQDLDRRYAELIHDYYGVAPYWQDSQGQQAQPDQQQQQTMPPVQQQPYEQQEPAQQPQ